MPLYEIKLALIGASGRMGKEIISAALKNPLFKIVALFDNDSNKIGEKIGDVPVEVTISDSISKASVVIDFTTPDASIKNLETSLKYNKPFIIGTTGLTENFFTYANKVSEKLPLVVSSNMSIGVNVLYKLVQDAAKFLPDYDIEIVESHHNKKIDSPSGTALSIAEKILSSKGGDVKKDLALDRTSKNAKRKRDEIGISSVRAGNIVGEHEVIFAGKNEVIKISHSAQNRKIFASGVLKAAEFLSKKNRGLFSMKEVLGL